MLIVRWSDVGLCLWFVFTGIYMCLLLIGFAQFGIQFLCLACQVSFHFNIAMNDPCMFQYVHFICLL